VILPLLLAAVAAAAAIGPEELGRELAKSAARAGIERVSVQSFAPADGASAAFGRDAADGVLRGIIASGRVRALEREDLAAVFAERRLSAAAGASVSIEAPRLSAGDGVLVGRLRRSPRGWTASVRLVSAVSGEIVAGGEADVSSDAPAASLERESFPPITALVDAAHVLAETRDAGMLERLADSKESPAPRRAAALLALAEIGAGDFSIADALRDPEALVRFAAAMSLGRTAAPWGEGPLRSMLRDDPSWLARFAAAQALSRYASPASAADLSRTQRTDASWSVRRQAAESAAARGVAAL
jgi:hypothetical protein